MLSRIILYGVDMKRILCTFLLLFLAIVSFEGCDRVDTEYVMPSIAEQYPLENRTLKVNIRLDSSISVASVSVDVVDDSLKKIRMVDPAFISEITPWVDKQGWHFEIRTQNYESSNLKITYTCVLKNGESATYTDYLDIAWSDDFVLDFEGTLRTSRIEYWVAKEHIPLYWAIRLGNRDLLDYFSENDATVLENQSLGKIRDYLYWFGGYYLDDAHFVESLDAIAKDFENVMSGKSKTPNLDSIKFVDNALFVDYTGVYFYDSILPSVYKFPQCNMDETRNTNASNKIEKSFYRDTLFHCDGIRWNKVVSSSSSSEPLRWWTGS